MIIGIDLGTTNSLACYFDEGEAKIIPNRLGENLTPSVVSIDEDDNIYVGKVAKERKILYPNMTAEVFKRSIGTEIKAEKVNYFHIDKGYETTDGEIAMDMEYMKYLMQDASPEKVDGGIRYTFYADYAFRVLFCKDVFFEQEQEYRIVLPNETIEAGRVIPCGFQKITK